MNLSYPILIFVGALFLGMLLCYEGGRRIGVIRLVRDPDGVAKGSGPVESAILSLLGLLLAFSFSGAGARFESRSLLIAEEANAIGTAYQRIDLLSPDAQPGIRQLFRRYADVRATAYRDLGDVSATEGRLAEGAKLQRQIWTEAVSAVLQTQTPPQLSALVLSSFNEMFDIAEKRGAMIRNHPPTFIFLMLGGLSFVCSLLLGYAMCGTKVRSWFYVLLFAGTMSITFYVILDLEYPRYGLIRIDAADHALVGLQKAMR